MNRYEEYKRMLELLLENYGDCLHRWEKDNFPNFLLPSRSHNQQREWTHGQEQKIMQAYKRVVMEADDIRENAMDRVGDCRAKLTPHGMIQVEMYDCPVGRPVSHSVAKILIPWLAESVDDLKGILDTGRETNVKMEDGCDDF